MTGDQSESEIQRDDWRESLVYLRIRYHFVPPTKNALQCTLQLTDVGCFCSLQ